MLMFRKLTQEENDIIDRFQMIKGQVANLELKKLEKRKEIEFFEERREMDYVPLIIWGLLTLSQIILLGMDLFFGWWNARFNFAIIMASMTPVVLLFCGFFFIKTLRTYILKNSKRPRYMQMAMDKGLENKWVCSAKLTHELEQINAELRVLKKEQGYLKLKVDEIEAKESGIL